MSYKFEDWTMDSIKIENYLDQGFSVRACNKLLLLFMKISSDRAVKNNNVACLF